MQTDFPGTFAEPVKNDARAGLGKMVERDLQRVFGRRREFRLEAEQKTALLGARFFDAQIFLENPDDVRRETALGEDFFPGVERFGRESGG